MKRRRLSSPSRRPTGFTLVETIMVIVIVGIIGGIVAVFIRAPVDGYVDTVARAEVADAADTALRRIAREIRTALPNSLRANDPPSEPASCFEFIPSVGGGRYRVDKTDTGGGDILDFTQADLSFDVLASTHLPSPPAYMADPHHVVVYNLGIDGADAYDAAFKNRARIAAGSPAAITLTGANMFPFESPGRRFDVVPDFSVVYSCADGALRRSTRPLNAVPLAVCPDDGAVLAAKVDCGQSFFSYTQAVHQRNGLLSLNLVMTNARGTERVTLYQEVHVDNTP